jgi:conjugal transfer ATP-binding protein TraC
MKPIQVPLALRAEIRLPVGPVELPLRAVIVMLAVAPSALLLFALPLSLTYQIGGAIMLLGMASAISRPNREGVWIGTWLFYRCLDPLLTRVIAGGRPEATSLRRVGVHLRMSSRRREPLRGPWGLARWTCLPRVREVGPGLFRRIPGGWSAVLELSGPRDAPLTEGYARWALAVVDWLAAVGCAAQVYTEASHVDRSQAQQAFEEGVRRERSVLVDFERDLAGRVAETSLSVRQYVVLTPRLVQSDGFPLPNRLRTLSRAADAGHDEAERIRDLALRQAETLRISVRPVDEDRVPELLRRTPVGCDDATFLDGEATIGNRHLRYGAVIELPGKVHAGAVMAAIIRSRVRGSFSFHLFPVQTTDARRELRRQRTLYEAMWRRSASADVEMLYQHTRALDEQLLSKETTAVRIGLSLCVEADTPDGADHAFERLRTALSDEDMPVERVTAATVVAAAAAAPGGLPLSRTLFLTTADVAAFLLPGQGTAFGEPARPLIGIDAATAATCWYSVFDRDNYSALILGSSGAGKSVASKTLLVRHFLQGADVLVVDPESEYGPVITALGGEYTELGEQSLNAFAIDPSISAEEAAGWVTRMLSVMAGEERDYRNNRPVRSLPAQDMAWLFREVVNFIQSWRAARGGDEPVLSDFCAHLEGPAMERARRLGVDGRTKRCADVAERLRAYTQGAQGGVFDRPSTASLTGRAVGIGLYRLANQLRSDLTPALAFVLAALLGELRKMNRRRIILIDEAHRVLADPDAGEVLADVVRTSRKRGAGVWMASQSIRDFLSSGSGDRPTPGEVLATVAATKLVLGVEHGLENGVQEAFNLSRRELAAITTQRRPGRGILIAESERAIVDILPGDHLMPVVETSSVARYA